MRVPGPVWRRGEDLPGTGNTRQTIAHLNDLTDFYSVWECTFGKRYWNQWMAGVVLAGDGTVNISAAANLYCSTTGIYISCATGPGPLTGMVLPPRHGCVGCRNDVPGRLIPALIEL